jgi:hypothetical protein
MIDHPSNQTFLKIVENKLLPNCPVVHRDISIADAIFKPNIGSLKGKTVHQGAICIETSLADIPTHSMTHCRDIVLGSNIMFVNKIPFFMTISLAHQVWNHQDAHKSEQCYNPCSHQTCENSGKPIAISWRKWLRLK